MRMTLRWLAAAVVLASISAGCGPVRLDGPSHISGTLVSVDRGNVGIKHKTGRTYQVEVTPETRIVNSSSPGDTTMCAGQRATIVLARGRSFTASSITLWSSRCR